MEVDVDELAQAIAWKTGVDLGTVARVLAAEEKLVRIRALRRVVGRAAGQAGR